jgi:hypothetical protein
VRIALQLNFYPRRLKLALKRPGNSKDCLEVNREKDFPNHVSKSDGLRLINVTGDLAATKEYLIP